MKNFLTKSIDQVWNVSGNFDAPSGDVKLDENGLFYDGILFHLKETLISGVHGVFSRKDTLHNISETPLHISALRV